MADETAYGITNLDLHDNDEVSRRLPGRGCRQNAASRPGTNIRIHVLSGEAASRKATPGLWPTLPGRRSPSC
jgi:hypothetical protein